jgi:tetratricopeptide (TPR) repeat protein
LDQTQDISQEELEQIERYLLHQMTREEETAFEAQLSSDVALRLKLEEMQLLVTAVKETVLKEKLDDYHEALSPPEVQYHIGRGKTSPWKTWLVAASAFLLAGMGGWLLLSRGNANEKLFAAHFQPDPGLITAMSATDNFAFENAMLDYKRKEYDAAIHAWDSLQKRQPANDTLNYFLGVAHLANENAATALPYLKKVPSSSFFYNDANWYAGLAYLKQGKKQEAIKHIEGATHPERTMLLEKLR